MSRHAIYSGSRDYVSELQRSYNAALVEIGEKAKQVAKRDELICDMWAFLSGEQECHECPYVTQCRRERNCIFAERVKERIDALGTEVGR